MTIQGLIDRFTFYATDSLDINYDPAAKNKSFLLCEPEAVNAAIVSGVSFPCLLLQMPIFDKEGDTDSPIEHVEASFLVLNRAKFDDFAGKMAVFNACKAIADQITFHIIEDSDTYFEGGLVKTSEGHVGPISDQVYGWAVNFGFDQGINAIKDPTRWRTN